MSRITPDNLDKWLFNLEEGNLTSSEKRELDQFLSAHPDLKEEADAWKMAHLSEPLAPYAYEAELHAITQTSVHGYRRYAALAGILLLLGGTAWFFLSGDETEATEADATAMSDDENGSNSPNTNFNTNANSNSIDRTSTYNPWNNNTVNGSNTSDHQNGNKGIGSSTINTNNHPSWIAALTPAAANRKSDQINGSHNRNGVNNSVLVVDAMKRTQRNNQNSNQNTLANNSKNGNQRNREQVTIDISNEVVIKNEKEVIYVTEEPNNEVNPTEKAISDSLILPLKDNTNDVKIADNSYSSTGTNDYNDKKNNRKRKSFKNSIDPNPTLTNLRDPFLLTTNNNLVDQYGGFAGGMIASRFTMNYRNTWTSKSDINSQNLVVSYDKLLRKIKTGIGFTANYNDYSSGMFTTVGASLTISPKFKLGRGITLEPFITGSYSQKTVNPERAIAGSFIEDRRGNVLQLYRNGMLPATSTAYAPDMKIGTVFQHKKFWAAASVDHLLMPKEVLYSTADHNMYKNDIEFRTTIGTDYIHRPETRVVYSPQMSIYYHDGYNELWAGLNTRFRELIVGAAYSQFKDFVTMIGFQNHAVKIVYQFDKTHSMLFNEKLASHELSVRFTLNGTNRNSRSILVNER